MSIIYMLLAISVFVALVFFVAFIFSVKKGQYDDTYTPSVRMLFEDEIIKEKTVLPAKKTTTKPIKLKEQPKRNRLVGVIHFLTPRCVRRVKFIIITFLYKCVLECNFPNLKQQCVLMVHNVGCNPMFITFL